MKNKKTKFLKFTLLIPIGTYAIFLLLTAFCNVVLMTHVKSIHSNMAAMYMYRIVSFFPLIIIICSYFVSHLYATKKMWGISGFALLIAIIIIVPLVITGDFLISLWFLFSLSTSIVLGVLLYVSYDWFRKGERQKELEKQNLQSELQLLKNQLNPHFLFNTLNNIDSLIRLNPDKASKSLVQMSEMMRYMIYETNVPKVSLNQELSHINNYLNLQRLQYNNLELVSYTVEGSSDEIYIAPMLFIPFIENAFKHCTDKDKKEAICFYFLIRKAEILFKASNIYEPSKQFNKDSSSGIGLSIVKRRLDYLYPSQYDLRINKENGYFDVSLKIKLND